MASRLCGSIPTLVAGIGFEVFTYVVGDDDLANHIYDLANNQIGVECAGIECVIPLLGTITRWFRQSCDDCCSDTLLP